MILTNDSYLTSLIADIESAAASIDIETYIFEDDDAGRKLADALCSAAKRGVVIRLLVDGIGSFSWGGQLAEKLKAAGIQTKIYHPVPFFISHWYHSTKKSRSIFSILFMLFKKINNRDHRKICIIDKNIVYAGSSNINAHILSHSADFWRDTNIKIIGADINNLQYAFDKAWGHIPLNKKIARTFMAKPADAVFRLNYSWKLRHVYYNLLLDKLSHCQNRIWVTNAYFIPEQRILKKLLDATKRGIEVRVILPQKSDVFIATLAAKTFYAELINHGVLIYEYEPGMLHAKILIIDNWYSIGSSNLNYRSLKHDLEIDVTIQTDEMKKMLEQQFMEDIKQSKLINMESLKNQSRIYYLLGRFILMFRYWI